MYECGYCDDGECDMCEENFRYGLLNDIRNNLPEVQQDITLEKIEAESDVG